MKLNDREALALKLLAKNGPLVPGRDRFDAWKAAGLVKALQGLARKGCVDTEDTDDGPRFTLTTQGEADAP
jgi:hypothetical protein